MKLYKAKIEESKGREWTVIPIPRYRGAIAKIYAVFYGGKKRNRFLHLRDADEDEFMSPLPGQEIKEDEEMPPVGVFTFDSPTPVKLPISYFDEDMDGKNKIVIWGQLFDSST